MSKCGGVYSQPNFLDANGDSWIITKTWKSYQAKNLNNNSYFISSSIRELKQIINDFVIHHIEKKIHHVFCPCCHLKEIMGFYQLESSDKLEDYVQCKNCGYWYNKSTTKF